MRSLEQALQDHDLIVLRVIGEWWEMDLTGMDKAACVRTLAQALAQLDMPQELLYLSPEEAAALQELIQAGGQVPVAAYSRTHGEVRLMGPGRLEREEPWFDPVSPAESLWYRGFLFRGFDETAEGLIEFYYLPGELLGQFPQAGGKEAADTAVSPAISLQPAAAPKLVNTAVHDAVDDLTTLLAAAQTTSLGPETLAAIRPLLGDANPDRLSLLMTLADEMGLLRQADNVLRPTRAAINWLKQSREAQLRDMAEAWSSSIWNDLCHTPGLRCEGEGWSNEPILARAALLDHLPRTTDWYRLADLVAHIKLDDPDFQRPDGNYDTWYVRDLAGDAYVTSFANWDLVEGRLLRFLVRGPLAWLGLTETGFDGDDLFHLTARGLGWLQGQPPTADEVRVPLVVQADATVLVPHNADRYQRFQVARISEAEPVAAGQPYLYRLTPATLAAAQQQGIVADRILQFLAEASGRPLPMSVKRSLARWAERGVEGRLETAVILRVREAGILETLRANPKTRPFLGESLGDLAVMVRRNDWANLREATAQLGLLLDDAGVL
ncbi:MAG: helicase-associated domain-containing protein [Chloroflexi bacterium]|nr:helicase-associated domain-containing protein [Chloroflexota bacterium]